MKETNTENKCVSVDHVLHGYQNGHSLIAASIDLSADAKRNLLVMSDMSGQRMISGYEEYITGYPIKDINSYAFAKTWYAPEMIRPGCVWTHTLLIRFTDLTQINNSEDILSYFKRPEEDNDFAYYSQALEIQLKNDVEKVPGSNNQTLFIEGLINLLYNSTDKSVLIEDQNSKNYEGLILGLWLQQWPRLKRNFSFCTGSIDPRLLNGTPLDLQIIPSADTNIKKNPSYSIINGQSKIDIPEKGHWAITIRKDLFKPSSLRDFLRSFGADVKPKRTSFKSLVRVYDFLQNNEDASVKEVVSILSEEFPLPDEALSLKNTFLTFERAFKNLPRVFSEEDILFELATTPNYSAFDTSKLAIKKRINALYFFDRNRAFELVYRILKSEVKTPIGEEILTNIASIIDESEIAMLNDNRELVALFLVLNPNIAYHQNFWDVPHEQQRERLNFLIKNNSEKINWSRMISIILENDLQVEAEIIEADKINAVDYILNWYNSPKGGSLNYKWINVLRAKQKEIVLWISENAHVKRDTIKLLIDVLNPNSSVVTQKGSLMWINISQNIEFGFDNDLERDFKAFVLAIAFNSRENNSLQLFEYSIETVYMALLNNKLNYHSWSLLEKHTPSLGLWHDWNKAKRLIIAVLMEFIKRGWDPNAFYSLFKDNFVRNKAYDQLK